MARRRRRQAKNAAKIARMEKRIQDCAQSPFAALAAPAEEPVAAATSNLPLDRFRALARAQRESQREEEAEKIEEEKTEKAPNLALVETPATALEQFQEGISSKNILLMPSFGIAHPSVEMATERILTHIAETHAIQRRADAQIAAGEDVVSLDAGYTRTSVLVILPSRNLALEFVRSLVPKFDQIDKLEQFEKDFGLQEPEDPRIHRKPADFQALFKGNVDDKFCVGLQISEKKAALYSEYKHADILIASPLGLSYYLGLPDGTDAASAQPDKSYLLASVEILFVPMLEVLLMQNWGRLKAVVARVNAPVELRDTSELGDFTRLKPHFAEGTAARHRQNIFTALFPHPYFTALFRQVCTDSEFSHEVVDESAQVPSALEVLRCRVRQYFLRLPAERGLAASHAERLRYFTDKLYPTRLSYYFASRAPTLIIVPTYYQYVAVRAFFEETMSESYSDLCEYTSDTDCKRALKNFNSKQVHVLLTTERYYFYKRRFIKGAVLLVWYAPPTFPQFYVEVVEAVQTQDTAASVLTLFSAYDLHALRRIVGDERARVFTQSDVADDVFCVH